MSRGRPRSLDRLPEAEAVKFRRWAGQARTVLGRTNAEIARALGWDRRAVDNVFVRGRPLRYQAASKLMSELYPRKRDKAARRAANLLDKIDALPTFKKALAAFVSVPTLAAAQLDTDFVAGYVIERVASASPGMGTRRSTELTAKVRWALDKLCEDVQATHKLWNRMEYPRPQATIFKKRVTTPKKS
jgi:hypothetical protein